MAGNLNSNRNKYIWDFKHAPGKKNHKILSIEIIPKKGKEITVDSGVVFKIVCYTELNKSPIYIGMSIYSFDGIRLTYSYEPLDNPQNIKKGMYKTNISLGNNILNKGKYYIVVWYGISFSENLVIYERNDFLEILPGENKTTSRDIPGILNPNFTFSTSIVEKDIQQNMNLKNKLTTFDQSLNSLEKSFFNLFLGVAKPKVIFELGIHKGSTTKHIIKFLEENHIKSKIYGFDLDKILNELIQKDAFISTYVDKNILKLVGGYLPKSLEYFLLQTNPKIDFVLIDANHKYKSVPMN